MTDFKVTGGCLCGGVKYEYTSRPTLMLICHCTKCRKALGAPYGAFVRVEYPKHFRLIKSETLRHYKSSKEAERSFCSNCGGGVYDRTEICPDKIFVNAGSIDGDPGISPTLNAFVKYKAPWVVINDGLPAFDDFPDIPELKM